MSADSPEGAPWDVSPSNLPWVEELYYAYQRDPASVDESWRREFERMDDGAAPAAASGNGNGNGNGHGAVARTYEPVTVGPEAVGNGGAVVARPAAIPVVKGPGAHLSAADAAEIAAVAAQRALGGKRVRR